MTGSGLLQPHLILPRENSQELLQRHTQNSRPVELQVASVVVDVVQMLSACWCVAHWVVHGMAALVCHYDDAVTAFSVYNTQQQNFRMAIGQKMMVRRCTSF